jgi:sugar lactone lactonase YvrE
MVKVGDAGTLGTITKYTTSTKSVYAGQVIVSYVIEPDTATTAIVNKIAKSYDASGRLSSTEQARSRIMADGTLTSVSADIVTSNGANHFVLAALPDTTSPTVASTDQTYDSNNPTPGPAITAIFSEPIDESTLTNATFTVSSNTGVPVTGTVKTFGRTAIFTPSVKLTIGTVYSAAISKGVKDLAGNKMLADYSWTLTPAVSIVSTYAGSISAGNANGTRGTATFYLPRGVALDGNGNFYVADTGNNVIRKITSAGVVSTFAGSGSVGNADDTGAAASFNSPGGVAVDSSGNVYVADSGNNVIRKINSAGVVSTFAGSGSIGNADGKGAAASFSYPAGVAVDGNGNVYVADVNNNEIRKITPEGGVSTFAGSSSIGYLDDTGTAAKFNVPVGIAADSSGIVYVADIENHVIRKITPAGEVSTLAGSGSIGSADGSGSAATFIFPEGITIDSNDNLFLSDHSGVIRKITAAGQVSTLAGSAFSYGNTNGTGAAATFFSPVGVAVDSSGNVYVADVLNNQIRKITPVP